MEIWKDINGYEGLYQVSSLGRVRSLDRLDRAGVFRKGKIIKSFTIPSGYNYVSLHKDGKKKNKSIHRLVALAFLERTSDNLDVNHKNGDKDDNRASNLEWCTHSDNMKHAVCTGLHIKFGQRKVLCVETGVIYDSAVEAAKDTDANTTNIWKVCNNIANSNTTGGYHWRYA